VTGQAHSIHGLRTGTARPARSGCPTRRFYLWGFRLADGQEISRSRVPHPSG
jgi:hypothetical protein